MPVCWVAVRKFFGVGNDLLAEVKVKAEAGQDLAPRYAFCEKGPNWSSRSAHFCEFVARLFRRIGEYQPDSNSLILPFFSRSAAINYLKEQWRSASNSLDVVPGTRTIYRYLSQPSLLKKIARSGVCDDVAATQPVSGLRRPSSDLPNDGQGEREVPAVRLGAAVDGLLVNVCYRKHQRFGRCQDCCESQIALAKCSCDADKNVILDRYQQHLESVKLQRMVYYRAKLESIENPDEFLTIIADGPDQYLTRVPHLIWDGRPPKYDDTCLPKLKLELVICHGRRGPNIFLYVAPPDKSHGSNMVIESFERTLYALQQSEGLPRRLHVQLDNPTGENKNKFVFAYLAEKISEGLLDRVDIMFLPPGHTHEDVDMRHHQYGSALKNREFVNAEQICQIVESCLSGHTSLSVSDARMRKRRMEKCQITGDIMLAHKKHMAVSVWEDPQVFIPSGTFEGLQEPPPEEPNRGKHDPEAASSLKRLVTDCPMCFMKEHVQHAIQLQLGTYPLLPHEREVSQLPRAVPNPERVRVYQSRADSSGPPLKKQRVNVARVEGTTIVGRSSSADPADRAIFKAMQGRPLKYTAPAKITIQHQRSCLNSRFIAEGGQWRRRSLSDLPTSELPKPRRYAFIWVEGGLDIDYARDCPGIGMVIKTPDWSVVRAEDRSDQLIEIQWACVEKSLLQRYKLQSLDRGVISPLLDPQPKLSAKRGKRSARLWQDSVPAEALEAWNIELTRGRMLPRGSLLFLEQFLKLDGVLRRDSADTAREQGDASTVERDAVVSSDSDTDS
ncbi:hypothetical protein FOZ63_006020 [Perkinsus olseni]|uniref:DUF7869 domain-containing protein n=1 Tax=Perkinsus olseni TaxID=32597 RepID=A0A7J6PT29_PEROL|nr:hypothetical protein FOZ63_006020 [Perkinsus olseni]KAF4755682.1 hypothetical protein FOZ62_029067 [Perkinsus olseni]